MRAIADGWAVEVRFRFVYPIAVRMPGFFTSVDPLWLPYLLTDVVRIAEMGAIPIGLPDPDPVTMDMATGEVAPEQPLIRRVTRLGIAAAEAGRGQEFAEAVGTLIWSGAVRGWNEGAHLAEAVAGTGLDLDALEAAIAGDPDRYEAAIAANEAAQRAAGHWGVPLMVFRGEPFFGQDRLDVLAWRMGRAGVPRRG